MKNIWKTEPLLVTRLVGTAFSLALIVYSILGFDAPFTEEQGAAISEHMGQLYGLIAAIVGIEATTTAIARSQVSPVQKYDGTEEE